MKRSLNIVFGSIIALAIVGLMLTAILPSWPFYDIASVNEARLWGHMQDTKIVVELGDTNGPFRLKGGAGGGTVKPFHLDLRVDGRITHWSQPASNNTGFVVTIFENGRGNDFAIVRKAKY
jgi:hypothetical protein